MFFFVFLSICLSVFFVFLSFCLFVFSSILCFVFLSFCLFVFLSWINSDQMSRGSQVSKVTICVKFLKWRSVTEWPRSGIELPGQLKIIQIKNVQLAKPLLTLINPGAANVKALSALHQPYNVMRKGSKQWRKVGKFWWKKTDFYGRKQILAEENKLWRKKTNCDRRKQTLAK